MPTTHVGHGNVGRLLYQPSCVREIYSTKFRIRLYQTSFVREIYSEANGMLECSCLSKINDINAMPYAMGYEFQRYYKRNDSFSK